MSRGIVARSAGAGAVASGRTPKPSPQIADFAGADLDGAELIGADLSAAKLRGAIMDVKTTKVAAGAAVNWSETQKCARGIPGGPAPRLDFRSSVTKRRTGQ